MINLPKYIPVFPLSNFIIFPKTTVPLNIFEPRYLSMVDECIKTNKMIGIIQPKQKNASNLDLYDVGCLGKISDYRKNDEGRVFINLEGVTRFEIKEEINNKYI